MKKLRPIFIAAAFAGLTVWLGYFVRRDQFGLLAAGWLAFFPLIFLAKREAAASPRALRNWLFLGIGLRGLLLFSMPNLTDDHWRFIWDGRLTLAGLHPFEHTPIFYLAKSRAVEGLGEWPPGLSDGLYEKLNSKRFHTVYPPVCQAVFAAAAFLGGGSDRAAVFWMKLFLLACECATLLLLRIADCGLRIERERDGQSATRNPQPAFIYALCPLPIFEVVGNCHFEGAMVACLLAGLVFLGKAASTSVPPAPPKGGETQVESTSLLRFSPPLGGAGGADVLAALFFSLSIAVKLLPLMFLPLILPLLGWKNWLKFSGWLALFSLALWLPMLDRAILQNMWSSLALYFRAFEFNASLYYLMKFLPPFGGVGGGFASQAASFLSASVVLTIGLLTILLFFKKIKPATALLAASMAQLLAASTVHPWYVLAPFSLCLLTKWRFPVAWAAVAVLSYSHYWQVPWRERFDIIGLEYAAVGLFLLLETRGRYFLGKPRLK